MFTSRPFYNEEMWKTLDELHLLRETRREWRDCCVFAFTETRLHDYIPDAAIWLEAMTSFRADREATSSAGEFSGGQDALSEELVKKKDEFTRGGT
ncbi:uncharacterized protein KZ484_023348 isoform 4-T5 [Pholidichthys leucotaenia]